MAARQATARRTLMADLMPAADGRFYAAVASPPRAPSTPAGAMMPPPPRAPASTTRSARPATIPARSRTDDSMRPPSAGGDGGGALDQGARQLGDRVACLLATGLAESVLAAHGMEGWDARGCGVLAAALATLFRRRGYASVRSFAIAVPDPVERRYRVARYAVGASPVGPFLDADGWHTADEMAARAGPGARIVPSEPGVGPVTGPVGVSCPQGAVKDLLGVLDDYLSRPFVVIRGASPDDEHRPTQLWTWSDSTGRIYLVDAEGHPTAIDPTRRHIPPNYDTVVALARADPRRQTCVWSRPQQPQQRPTGARRAFTV